MVMIAQRFQPLIFMLTAVLLGACSAEPPAQHIPWPTNEWMTSTPEAQGLHADPLSTLDAEIEAGRFGHVDRLVVVRHGFLVVNARYDNDYTEISRGYTGALGCGQDSCPDPRQSHEYNYYHPGTHPYYQGRDIHSLQSVTKSVTSSLIGIAIERGEIDDVSAPLLGFFQEFDLSHSDARLHRATLGDLLTMRSGIEWHEQDRPLDDTNTTLQLEHAQDWIRTTGHLGIPLEKDTTGIP